MNFRNLFYGGFTAFFCSNLCCISLLLLCNILTCFLFFFFRSTRVLVVSINRFCLIFVSYQRLNNSILVCMNFRNLISGGFTAFFCCNLCCISLLLLCNILPCFIFLFFRSTRVLVVYNNSFCLICVIYQDI